MESNQQNTESTRNPGDHVAERGHASNQDPSPESPSPKAHGPGHVKSNGGPPATSASSLARESSQQPLPAQPAETPEEPYDLRSELEPMRPRLLGILRRFRIPTEDAEDVLQDVLVDFVQKRRFIEDPAAWLVIVTRRRCLDYSRQRRRRFVESFDAALLELVAGGVSAPQEHETLMAQLTEAIDTLRPKCRDLLRMRYIEGRTESEIAALKGYKANSISKICGRCVTALAKRITEPPELRGIGNDRGPRN